MGTNRPCRVLWVVLDGKEANKSDEEGVFRFDGTGKPLSIRISPLIGSPEAPSLILKKVPTRSFGWLAPALQPLASTDRPRVLGPTLWKKKRAPCFREAFKTPFDPSSICLACIGHR